MKWCINTSLKRTTVQATIAWQTMYTPIYLYYRIKDYFVELVNKLLKDKNVDVIFNVVKYMKDILGSQYNVNIII